MKWYVHYIISSFEDGIKKGCFLTSQIKIKRKDEIRYINIWKYHGKYKICIIFLLYHKTVINPYKLNLNLF